MTPEPASYHRHHLPAEIIGHAIWLYRESIRVAWRA
jgi:hypothetical protein